MPDYTKFNGVDNYWDSQITDQVRVNMNAYIDWAFLGIGAFFNVNIPTSGSYGGNFHQLRMVSDPYYTDGRVWESARSNWVWETGIEYGYQPIRVSGVNVNNTFLPIVNTGNPFAINYPQGRVIFNNAISTSSTVTAEYSYKYVRVFNAAEDWFNSIQYNSLRVDDPQFLQQASGVWNNLARNRVQLPAIGIDVSNRLKFTPFEMGSIANYQQRDMMLYVLGETQYDRDQIHDIFINQIDKTLYLFDVNRMTTDNKFPLVSGSPVPSAMMYPSLLAETGAYRWKPIDIKNIRNDGYMDAPPLYTADLKVTYEVILP